jgi:hypothetical protein
MHGRQHLSNFVNSNDMRASEHGRGHGSGGRKIALSLARLRQERLS